MICAAHQIFFGATSKKGEMGGSCGMYGGGEICMQASSGEA
jgi:hypothetical protein